MSYNELVNKVVTTKIFPNLVKTEQLVLIKNIIRVINSIDSHINPTSFYNQLSVDSNKDIYLIVNMILPFIEEPEKYKLKYFSEIPTKFTNLQYNLGENYKFGSNDIIKATDYLVNETIPKVIHKLYVNWVDIYPNVNKNDGFHSIIKFIPEVRKHKNKKLLYNSIEKNVRNNIEKWEEIVFYFLSSDKKKVKYKDLKDNNNLLKQFSNLDQYKVQNWFDSETFYWLAQIHFYNHVLSSRVIYMTAGTGVGKSTHIPKIALYTLMAFEDVKEPKIIVTQPRQTPAQDVPGYISQNMGISIKDYNKKLLENEIDTTNQSPFYIQFQHGDAKHMGKSSTHRTIKYVTDQLLFNELLENPSLLNENGDTLYDIIMIDEAHEHNIRMDLILTIVKKTLELNSKIRLMIISATMDDDEARYRQFFNSIEDKSEKDSIYKFNPYVDRRLHIAHPLEKNRFKIIEEFEKKPVEDYIESGINKIKYITTKYSRGDILFFLTGTNEIITVCDRLNTELPSHIIAIPLYSEMEEDRKTIAKSVLPKDIKMSRKSATLPLKDHVNNSLGKYTQKVVLATTIAEASLTIDNLKFVIDIGFSNSPLYNPEKKIQTLEKVGISKSSHTQRRGRVGRISDGLAFYLYTKEDIMSNKIIADIKTNDLSDSIFNLLKNSKDSLIGVEKDILIDLNGSFYIVHPEDNDQNIRLHNGLFKIPLTLEQNKYIMDGFEHLEELKLIDQYGYRSKLGVFLLELNRFTKLTIFDKLTIIYACQNNLLEFIIPIISFTSSMSFDKLFTNIKLGLTTFCKLSSDHITILNIFVQFQNYANKLFICNYSKKIIDKKLKEYLQDNSPESKVQISNLLKEMNIYFNRFQIYNKNEKTLYENMELLIEKELELIKPWCQKHHISPLELVKYLGIYCQYKIDANEIKEILDNYGLKKIKNYDNLNKYSKIIRLLVDCNPRNICYINSNGIYQTNYGVEVSIKVKYIKQYKKVIKYTCYNKYSKYIFFSQIRDLGETVEINFISNL